MAGALATLAGTLDGVVPTYAEWMGNFDGAVLVGTVEGIAAVDLVLMGNLEDTLEDMVVTGTTLAEEGTELVVTELVGTSPSVLRQVAALAWSPAPFVKANPVEEEDKEVSGDGTDAMAPVKWLIRRAVRGRGLKDTVGDTGPWGGVGLESTPTGEETTPETNPKDHLTLRTRERSPSLGYTVPTTSGFPISYSWRRLLPSALDTEP